MPVLRPAQERYVPFLHRIGAIGNIVIRLFRPFFLGFGELVVTRHKLIVIQIVSCRDRIDRSADDGMLSVSETSFMSALMRSVSS